MLYKIVRPIAAIAFKVYFKKIYLENADALPKDKPVFIASNHPTAFIEPCLLACFLPQPLHFFVKGELFKKAFYNKLMASVHLIPLYRRSDGDTNAEKKNREVFKNCYEALAQNKTMLIMPEGSTKQVKRLRPLKKGLARMCFGAIEANPGLDIHIVPIGSNFTYADRPRTEVMIKVGESIRVLDYWNAYLENPNKAIRKLTQNVYNGMSKTVIHIEEETDELLAERLFQITRSENEKALFPIVEQNPTPLARERKIAEQINSLSGDEKESRFKATEEYFEKLESFRLREGYQKNRTGVLDLLLLIFGFIPACLGALFHAPVISFANYIRRTKVWQLEFKQPVWLAVIIVSMPLYYFLWTFSGFFIDDNYFRKSLLLTPLFGYISLIYRDLYINSRNRLRFNFLPEKTKAELPALRKKITDLISF